ncbi:MAG: acetylornithine transaminase [gamma proteobacterium symbiont of Bathyaustriella thionipta]|nr:acetylornithine transaminase [gamma proteobacterium symbiont of Bathyaustriella thionipta]
MSDSLMHTYKRLPVTFSHGSGCWLTDENGHNYLDALSGIAVCSLGHAHPAVAKALCEQAGLLVHTSNLYQIGLQQQLGDRLCRLADMERVFFGNSGAEANEAAIKLARLYGTQRHIKNPTIIVMRNSFHGRTLATLSASGNPAVQAGFEPLVSGFIPVDYNDVAAVEALAAEDNSIVAILVEPIQGEGGVNIPAPDYLNRLRALCDQHDWLLMLDEIQTGMGRTGQWFAHQHNGIRPDVMTLAKALGNGVPIGACLASGKAADVLSPGTHGSTFGGNPLACAAALAVLDVFEQDNIVEQAKTSGEQLLEKLSRSLAHVDGIVEIRGQGMMLGIELDRPAPELVADALQDGLLINVTAARVVRLLPPLILSLEEMDLLVEKLSVLIKNFLA